MALSKITNLSITDDTIVNADINSSAAIALSKLASTPATLTGSSDNTIVTVTGANAMQGETSFTCDSTTYVKIKFQDTAPTETSMGTAHANDAVMLLGGANSGTTQGSLYLGGQSVAENGVEGAVYGFSGGNQNAGLEFLEGTSDAYGQIKMSVAQGTGGTLVEAMRIASSGNVSIGGTASAGLFNLYSISHLLNGTVHTNSSDTGTIHNLRVINASDTLVGGITNDGSNTAFATSSDYRLKENETSITDGIDRIKQLKPYRFNFKADADKIMDGFFAHEVSSIVPEAVTGEKDAMIPEVLYAAEDELPEGKNIGDIKKETKIEPQGIDQSKLVPLLVAAVKELTAKVEALENA